MNVLEEFKIIYQLDFETNTAKVINSPDAKGDIIIPKSIKYKSNEFIINEIGSKSFYKNKKIKTIDFPIDSELRIINKKAFSSSSLETLILPSKLNILEEGWCSKTTELTKIIISPENPYFKYLNNTQKVLIGKSNLEADDYDNIVFANRHMPTIFVPPNIKRINSDAFSYSKLQNIKFAENSQLITISNNAFKCSLIESVNIPPSVKELGKKCFCFCEKMRVLTFSEDSELEVIGRNAFTYTKIRNLFIPSKVRLMRGNPITNTNNLFDISISPKNRFFMSPANCKGLILCKKDEDSENHEILVCAKNNITTAIIPPYVTSINSFAFYKCESLESIMIPNDSNLRTIEEFAFYRTSIDYIRIPKTVRKIGTGAFGYCQKLSTVIIPTDSELTTIEKSAFSQTLINNLYIPSNTRYLEKGWLNGFNILGVINVSSENQYFKYLDESKQIIVGRKDVENDDYDEIVFADRLIKYAFIPSNIKKIGPHAFNNCHAIVQIDFPQNSQLEFIGEDAFSESSISSIIIPPHVTRIPERAFCNCHDLRSVIFEKDNQIVSFGNSAFFDTDIEEFTIPISLKSIGDNAFACCPNLNTFIIPENSELTSIGIGVFENSPIESLFIPANVNEIDEGWCSKMNDLTQITLSPNNKNFIYIDNKMLIGKSKKNKDSDEYDLLLFARRDIKSIVIPSFVRIIGAYAFNSCKSLEKVKFSESPQLIEIHKAAFRKTALESISIPKSVQLIDSRAFASCHNLHTVEIPPDSECHTIGNTAFLKCPIEQISIPKSVLNIDSEAFYRCEKMTDVFFDEESQLTSISMSAFSFSGIERISIPDSVRTISDFAFNECNNLRKIEISENSQLISIGNEAFNQTQIGHLFIPSKTFCLSDNWCYDIPTLNDITISSENEYITYLDDSHQIVVGHYKSTSDTFDSIIFANRNIENVFIPSQIITIRSNSFNGCSCIQKVDFAKNSKLLYIGYYGFAESQIRRISLPDSLKIIERFAFANCPKLETVYFSENSNLCVIEMNAFLMSSIKYFSAPKSTIIIKSGAFKNCNNFNAIELLGEKVMICDICNSENFFLAAFPNSKDAFIEINIAKVNKGFKAFFAPYTKCYWNILTD